MPTGRKRSPPPTRRHALEAAILIAHGFTRDMLVNLIRAGLATAGGRPLLSRRARAIVTGAAHGTLPPVT
jgi:hypothetical protein